MTNLNLMPHEAERNPIVFVRDGEVFANSREVAIYFDKRHDDVMKAIRKLVETEPTLGLRNFADTPYVDGQNGQTYRSFDMDQDGFALLAMGFTGQKALRWKLKYIEAFNTMRAQLAKPQAVDYNDPAVLLGAFSHLQALVGEKDKVIVAQGERLQVLDRLEAAKGSMCITDAAKTLGVGRDYLFQFMFARKWTFKRAGNKNWLAYDDKRRTGYLEHDDHLYMDNLGQERVATRVLVTAKGLVKLSELLEQPLH